LSTIDEFQKRITKLEADMVEIKKALEEIAKATPKPTLPEASDYVPEEGIAEEAVEEASKDEDE
jgi:hypothetical protein